jgi:hypothetical protein
MITYLIGTGSPLTLPILTALSVTLTVFLVESSKRATVPAA